MSVRLRLASCFLALSVVLGSACVSVAAPGEGHAPISAADWAAVEHCLTIVRNCQLPDGMFRMKGKGEPVWGNPYFGNVAAMALLAGHRIRPNETDVVRVERWLAWYGRNQEADGTIYDREGMVSAYASNGKRDSTDSYAATFLMVAWRYTRAIAPLRPSSSVTAAAGKALAAIRAVVQDDGLTIAKPEYPIKYLMDNIEVYQGLFEAGLFFEAVGQREAAAEVRAMADRIAGALPGLWPQGASHAAYARDLAGTFATGLAKPYPHGLAQLFVLAHLRPARPQLWRALRERFRDGDTDGMPLERWLMAARRCASPEELAELRDAMRREALRFSPENVYIHRPALAVIALLDGEARFADVPSVAGP